ncbi:MAG: Holliday junction branch migration protein RuvA [Firmicutes bacterium]|nr:Holliday junction branch migration protein RuvA [Bacillota bacterium]
MYDYIKGTVATIEDGAVTLETGVVGYAIIASPPLLDSLAIGDLAKIYVYFDIKETSHTLYGFTTKQERELFRVLLSASGVGSKTALSLLSLGVNKVVSCIAGANSLALTGVKGISQKTADKIIVELRTKILKSFKVSDISTTGNVVTSAMEDAIFGLCALGLSRVQAIESIKEIDTTDLAAEEIIRQILSKRGGK